MRHRLQARKTAVASAVVPHLCVLERQMQRNAMFRTGKRRVADRAANNGSGAAGSYSPSWVRAFRRRDPLAPLSVSSSVSSGGGCSARSRPGGTRGGTRSKSRGSARCLRVPSGDTRSEAADAGDRATDCRDQRRELERRPSEAWLGLLPKIPWSSMRRPGRNVRVRRETHRRRGRTVDTNRSRRRCKTTAATLP